MPEGPEVRHIADCLIKAMQYSPVNLVRFAYPRLKNWEQQLCGETICKIESRGKALLIWFANNLVLYSHNQLYGSWCVVKAGVLPKTQRKLRVRLDNQHFSALLYSASEIDILSTQEVNKHPFLVKMGPDVLDPRVTIDLVQERMTSKKFFYRQLGTLLLDQSFIAGIGNYLRAEVLWQAKQTAQCSPSDLNEDRQRILSQLILDVPRLAYISKGGQLNIKNQENSLFVYYVFRRDGQSCQRCGHIIKKTTFSGRPFYSCSWCQP